MENKVVFSANRSDVCDIFTNNGVFPEQANVLSRNIIWGIGNQYVVFKQIKPYRKQSTLAAVLLHKKYKSIY